MADKKQDQPFAKRVRESLKDPEGVHASQIFGQELKKETFDKIKMPKSWAGGVITLLFVAYAGSAAGLLTYGVQDHERPIDTDFTSANVIKDGANSYSAFSVARTGYLLMKKEDGGYALYIKDKSEGEYDLVTNASVALSHLHAINLHLEKAQSDLASGSLPDSSSGVAFQDVEGLSILHEEERDSFERHFESSSQTGVNYKARLENLSLHVENSALQIFNDNNYDGNNAWDLQNAPEFDSSRDYSREGAKYGFYAWLLLLAGGSLARSAGNTGRRLRNGNKKQTQTPK
jgi:hypothetical protein